MSSRRPFNAAALLQGPQREIVRPSKGGAHGVSIKIRYLPPSIKRDEVERILGDEWKAGHGKVLWAQFQRGRFDGP